MIIKTVKGLLRGVAFVAFIALVLAIPNCAEAQEGIISSPQPSIEELLSVTGPIDMNLVWDYLDREFGDPYVRNGVIIFQASVPDGDNILHIQAVSLTGQSMHMDLSLDNMKPGRATADDTNLRFVWLCRNEDITESSGNDCTLPISVWVMAYDRDQKVLLWWPDRITK